MRLSGAVVVLFSLAVPAQTFIVDVNNGPGTNFMSIATAATTVPDGSVLIVREGHYSSFAVTGKSLTVLGETVGTWPFVTFGEMTTGSITISGLAATQRVVLRNLRSSGSGLLGVATVTCQNCQGAILLDGVQQGPGGSLCLAVDHCLQVQVTNCAFTGGGGPYGAHIVASDVMVVDSQFRSGPNSPGLQQVGGRVQMAGSQLSGAAVIPGVGAPGVLMQGGELRLLQGCTVAGGQGFTNGLAIAGSGSVRVDPGAVLSGQAPLVAPGVVVTSMAMPDVRATGGQLGSAAASAMNVPSGTFGVLMLGIPDAPLFVPGWTDPFWMTGGVIMSVGMSGPPIGASVAVPNNPALTGACFGWQGLSIDASFAIQVSNAAWFVIRP